MINILAINLEEFFYNRLHFAKDLKIFIIYLPTFLFFCQILILIYAVFGFKNFKFYNFLII